MQFSAAHKTCTYVMLTAAYLALIGGGAVDPLTMLLGTVGLIASWWIEPPRFDLAKHQLAWTIASMVALTYALLLVVTRGDLLGGGTTLIVFLAVAKACQRRTTRDWGQLVFLSVAMLIAASVLNTGILFAVCFAVFVLTSTWAFTMLHLRREVEERMLLQHQDETSRQFASQRILSSRRIVTRRFFVSTGLVSLAVFGVTVLIFLSIPRVGVGFAGRQQESVSMVGFSDGVQLGNHGTLKRDQTIVMRVKVDPKYQGRAAPYLHWRGVALDRYSKGQWTRSPRAPQTESLMLPAGPNRIKRVLVQGEGIAEADLMRQEIWLEPLDTNVLFGASMPIAMEYNVPPNGPAVRSYEKNDEFRFNRREAISYVAYSRLTQPAPEALMATDNSQGVPPNFGVYRQLPPEITQRTRDLARTIVGDAANDYEKAIRLRDWLRQEMAYTLDLKDPQDKEPVDFFLFERKSGHCEYFASAFVIMARELGLYTRQVNGFLGGEWNEYDNYLAVRAGDAHSWAEVYFHGVGWITMDATAAAATDQLGRGSSGPLDKLRRLMDSLRFQWSKWVVDYSFTQQLGLLRDMGRAIAAAIGAVKAGLTSGMQWLLARWYWLVIPLAVVAGAWLLWRRRGRGGDGAPAREENAIATLFSRVERALAQHGFSRPATVTPREFAAQIHAQDPSWSEYVTPLVAHYYEAQWGHTAASAQAIEGAVEAVEQESARRISLAAAQARTQPK